VSGHRRLEAAQTAWRIGDPDGEHPIWSAEGARLAEGRWHQSGDAVIHAAEHYSTAMLEKLVHLNGILPANQHFIEIAIPAGTSYEVVTPDSLPGWHSRDARTARAFGHRWLAEARSAILFVPSVVARMERNILVNPAHPDAGAIRPGLETPVWWDRRLFA
jgi:RES domain-containing protein